MIEAEIWLVTELVLRLYLFDNDDIYESKC